MTQKKQVCCVNQFLWGRSLHFSVFEDLRGEDLFVKFQQPRPPSPQQRRRVAHLLRCFASYSSQTDHCNITGYTILLLVRDPTPFPDKQYSCHPSSFSRTTAHPTICRPPNRAVKKEKPRKKPRKDCWNKKWLLQKQKNKDWPPQNTREIKKEKSCWVTSIKYRMR